MSTAVLGGFGALSATAKPIPVPPVSRTYIVPQSNRTVTVTADPRVYAIPPSDRTITA